MRVAVAMLIACSSSAPSSHVDPAAPAPTAAPATPIVPAPPPPTAAPLDPGGLTFVDVPALHPPSGVRAIVGLEVDNERAALSPAGDVLAIAGAARGVQLVHLPSGRGLAVRADLTCKEPDPGAAGCEPMLAFAADGKRVAVYWPQLHRLVALAVPAGTTAFDADVTDVAAMRFVDDGRLAVLRDKASYAFDLDGTRRDLGAAAGPLAISGDGRRLVVANHDTVRITDTATGKTLAEPPAGLDLRDVRFTRDGWVAITVGEWPEVVTWRAGDNTARVLADSSAARKAAGGLGVYGFALAPSLDEVFVDTTAGIDGIGLDGERRSHSPWLRETALDAVALHAGELDLLAGACPLRLDAHGELVPGPLACALRPVELAFDGDRLDAMTASAGLLALDAHTGALVSSRADLDLPFPSSSTALAAIARDPDLAAHVRRALALPGVKRSNFQLSRDHKLLFVNNDGQSSAIVDLTTDRARTKLNPFVVSRDGSRIGIELDDRTDAIEIRSTATDKKIATVPVPTMLVDRMLLSDDGRLLVAEGEGHSVVIDVASGRPVFEAPCHTPFALSADARLLVCDSRAVEVYDVPHGKLLKSFPHPNSESADAIALSDDGRHLAIGVDNIWLVDL